MRSLRSRLRPLLVIGAVVGAAVLYVPAVLGFLDMIGWVDVFTLTLLGVLGTALTACGLATLPLSRRVGVLSKSVSTAVGSHSRRINETLGHDRLEAARRLEGVHDRFTRLQEHTLPRMSREVRKAVTVQGARRLRVASRLDRTA